MEIISGLFVNATIMMSALSVVSIFANRKNWILNSISKEMSVGFFAGLLGCVLMLYSVKVTDEQMIDFRIIPIVLVGIYYSAKASLLTSFIISTFRLLYFGVNYSSVVAVFSVTVITVIIYYICIKNNIVRTRWIFFIISMTAVASISFAFLLKGNEYFAVFVPYAIGHIILSFVMYTFSEYFKKANDYYKKAIDDSEHDYLTGLLNLRRFDALYNSLLLDKTITSRTVSVLFVDVNDFKCVNDQYGHSAGDIVLVEIGKVLEQICKNVGVVARLGGDEFVVLLQDVNFDDAEKASAMIKNEISKLTFSDDSGKEFIVSAAIGISNYPETVDSIDRLLATADSDMYRYKSNVNKRHLSQ